MRIRFAGFGGQGVVLCGYIFGKAAMLDGKNSIHTQSYGSASRGGLTKSDVGIEQGEIYDLAYQEVDILVALSQQSYAAYLSALRPEGMLFYEQDLVQIADRPESRTFGAGVTDIAFKRFGRKIMANMIMMGFVNEIARLVSRGSLERTIQQSVPPGTQQKNIEAFETGLKLGAQLRGGSA
jgi:2-oxoglutarate ferredoxin oxidoreductase subunit gamma